MSKKLLSLALVVCMALSLLPATAQAAGDTLYEVDMTTSNPDIQLYYMIYRLNKYREENGLSPVKLDKELTKAAMQRAAEIAVYYDANHIRPNGQPWYTVSGIRGSKTAENIAYGYQDPFKMVTAWADSPAHNTNMLSKDFKSVGIGYFCPNPGQYFWVQDFSSDEVKDELVIDLSEATHNTTRMTYSVEALGSNLPLAFTAQAEELTVGRTIPSGYAVIGNKGLSGGNVRAVIRKVESLNPDLASAVLNNDGTVSITGLAPGEAQFKFTIGNNCYFTITMTVKPTAASTFTRDAFVVDTSPEVYTGRAYFKSVQSSAFTYHTDYEISYQNNTDAGTGTIVITGSGEYYGQELVYSFTIEKAERELSPRISKKLSVHSDPHATVWTGDNASGTKTYRFTSSNTNVVRVDDQGELYAVAPGYSTITIEADETKNYKAGRASLEVMVTEWSFDEKPSVETPPPGSPDDPAPPASAFSDVPAGAYYADAVAWAVQNDITTGTGATTFSPDTPCTRAQAVTFMWRANDMPKPYTVTNPFWDVRFAEYYYQAVMWAMENGITSGTSERYFSPDAPCTRAQIVTFLWRAAGEPYAGGSGFSDVAEGAYYAQAVAWAVENGITGGTGGGKFSPDDTCTRAQIVTFLYRASA